MTEKQKKSEIELQQIEQLPLEFGGEQDEENPEEQTEEESK